MIETYDHDSPVKSDNIAMESHRDTLKKQLYLQKVRDTHLSSLDRAVL